MGIIEDRIQKATGGGAHMPNGAGSGYDRHAAVSKSFDAREHRDKDGKWTAGDSVRVGDVSSQLHGAVDAKVVGRSKTLPKTHTVVEAGGKREAVRTDSLSPGVGHSSHPVRQRRRAARPHAEHVRGLSDGGLDSHIELLREERDKFADKDPGRAATADTRLGEAEDERDRRADVKYAAERDARKARVDAVGPNDPPPAGKRGPGLNRGRIR